MPDYIELYDRDKIHLRSLIATCQDPFTLDTFEQLVAEYTEAGKSLIVAEVATLNNPEKPDQLTYFYYSANQLNKILFRKYGNPNINPNDDYIFRLFALNPLTNTDIYGDVNYYVIRNAFGSTSFDVTTTSSSQASIPLSVASEIQIPEVRISQSAQDPFPKPTEATTTLMVPSTSNHINSVQAQLHSYASQNSCLSRHGKMNREQFNALMQRSLGESKLRIAEIAGPINKIQTSPSLSASASSKKSFSAETKMKTRSGTDISEKSMEETSKSRPPGKGSFDSSHSSTFKTMGNTSLPRVKVDKDSDSIACNDVSRKSLQIPVTMAPTQCFQSNVEIRHPPMPSLIPIDNCQTLSKSANTCIPKKVDFHSEIIVEIPSPSKGTSISEKEGTSTSENSIPSGKGRRESISSPHIVGNELNSTPISPGERRKSYLNVIGNVAFPIPVAVDKEGKTGKVTLHAKSRSNIAPNLDSNFIVHVYQHVEMTSNSPFEAKKEENEESKEFGAKKSISTSAFNETNYPTLQQPIPQMPVIISPSDSECTSPSTKSVVSSQKLNESNNNIPVPSNEQETLFKRTFADLLDEVLLTTGSQGNIKSFTNIPGISNLSCSSSVLDSSRKNNYVGLLIATDTDFLQRHSIRQLFCLNSLEEDDAFLYDIPEEVLNAEGIMFSETPDFQSESFEDVENREGNYVPRPMYIDPASNRISGESSPPTFRQKCFEMLRRDNIPNIYYLIVIYIFLLIVLGSTNIFIDQRKQWILVCVILFIGIGVGTIFILRNSRARHLRELERGQQQR